MAIKSLLGGSIAAKMWQSSRGIAVRNVVRPVSFIAIAVIAASQAFSTGSARAQSSPGDTFPAEFPPSSFTGTQYVDSRGCVFIRGGVDGSSNWIPRVDQNRNLICGFEPSLPQIATSEPAAPASQPSDVEIVIEAPAQPSTAQPSPTVAQAQPQAASAEPAPAAAAEPAQEPVSEPREVRVVTATPIEVQPPETMAPRENTCRWASDISEQYMRAPAGINVRCGPQEDIQMRRTGRSDQTSSPRMIRQPPTTEMIRQASLNRQPVPLTRSEATKALSRGESILVLAPGQTTTVVSRDTRVVPEAVYANQVASTRGVVIPEGYEPVWEDDRLNPRRAHQTLGGIADTEMVWTNTVPRRLILRETGTPVSARHPGLVSPPDMMADQHAPRATVSTRGSIRQDNNLPMPAGFAARERSGAAGASGATGAMVAGISATQGDAGLRAARSEQVVRLSEQPPSHRYVQVGMFADPAFAGQAAQRIADEGMPSMLASVTRSGIEYGVVISGPYASQAQVERALQRLRGMGYAQASLRR